LCWIHAERVLAKLLGFNDEQRAVLEQIRTAVNLALKRMADNKSELLMVLDCPELALPRSRIRALMNSRRPLLGWGLVGVCALFMACGRSGLDARSGHHGNPDDSGRSDVGDSGAAPDASSGKDAMIVVQRDSGASTCGNGFVDPGEECDDGNTLSDDGCSSLCKVECDFTCGCGDPSNLCKPLVICGDGVQSPSEGCDDGNTNNGDGCSANCQVEPHWVCPVPGRPCAPMCGDGVLVGTETCDDGNTVAGDGCGENCLIEGGGPSCGDGVTSGTEECDDGALNNGSTYGACTNRCKYSRCGDGIVNGPEECDLGDARNKSVYGDIEGCTSACTRPHYCGDGIIDSDYGEMCDLGTIGNTVGYYCTPRCIVWLP
jgi:cysteine-rich repeat protein